MCNLIPAMVEAVMRLYYTIITCIMLLLLPGLISFTAAGSQKINVPLDTILLEKGDLQVFEFKQPAGKRVIGVILIDAPPAKVWKVTKNWARVPEYSSSVKYYKTVHLVGRNSGTTEKLIEGKMKVAFLSIVYTLDVLFDDNAMHQKWRLLTEKERSEYGKNNINLKENDSKIKRIDGFGYVEAYDNGTRSLYYYAPAVEVSVPVPAFVERALVKSSLHDFMKGVKRAAEAGK